MVLDDENKSGDNGHSERLAEKAGLDWLTSVLEEMGCSSVFLRSTLMSITSRVVGNGEGQISQQIALEDLKALGADGFIKKYQDLPMSVSRPSSTRRRSGFMAAVVVPGSVAITELPGEGSGVTTESVGLGEAARSFSSATALLKEVQQAVAEGTKIDEDK